MAQIATAVSDAERTEPGEAKAELLHEVSFSITRAFVRAVLWRQTRRDNGGSSKAQRSALQEASLEEPDGIARMRVIGGPQPLSTSGGCRLSAS